ncbi:MAG: trimeric intracellular cation channel family protein [Devosia sp.]
MIADVPTVPCDCREARTHLVAAGRRKMDWFGVCVLACVTAPGGGTMRDTVPGHYPLTWVEDPYPLLICCAAALITIGLARFMEHLRWPFLLLDALGLVVFTILGCGVGREMGQSPIIVIVAGMITGIAGGIMRDVLRNDVPLVFSSELYATVSIVTGVVYFFGLQFGFPGEAVIIAAPARPATATRRSRWRTNKASSKWWLPRDWARSTSSLARRAMMALRSAS